MALPDVHANGAQLPAIGLGTAWLEGRTCTEAVAAALQAGARLIDTAARYGNEQAVGEGLRASGLPRRDMFVATKVYWTDLAPKDVLASVEGSLKRLGLSEVDLLLIHWPNPKIPLADTIPAFNAAKRSGLARNIGVANFTTRLLDEAAAASEEPLAVNQCEYHPYLDQSKLLLACRKHGLAFMSYSPLRQAGPDSPLTDPVVVDIAKAKAVTPAQVVLRWHVQQGVIPLPRSSSPARVKLNARLDDFALDAHEMAAISALSRPDGRKVRPPHAPEWD
ncbi:MAG: aldo/keto reductase [Hyphomicrobiaceae bacterium]